MIRWKIKATLQTLYKSRCHMLMSSLSSQFRPRSSLSSTFCTLKIQKQCAVTTLSLIIWNVKQFLYAIFFLLSMRGTLDCNAFKKWQRNLPKGSSPTHKKTVAYFCIKSEVCCFSVHILSWFSVLGSRLSQQTFRAIKALKSPNKK